MDISKYEYGAYEDDVLDVGTVLECLASHRYLLDEASCLRRLYLLKKKNESFIGYRSDGVY